MLVPPNEYLPSANRQASDLCLHGTFRKFLQSLFREKSISSSTFAFCMCVYSTAPFVILFREFHAEVTAEINANHKQYPRQVRTCPQTSLCPSWISITAAWFISRVSQRLWVLLPPPVKWIILEQDSVGGGGPKDPLIHNSCRPYRSKTRTQIQDEC